MVCCRFLTLLFQTTTPKAATTAVAASNATKTMLLCPEELAKVIVKFSLPVGITKFMLAIATAAS